MSKKNSVSNETVKLFDLQAAMESHPNVSLRKLAQATDVCYGWLLKKSKEPKPGTVYDPESVNYEAVARVFASKGIDLETLDWQALNATAQRSTTLTKDMEAFTVGSKVFLREDNEVPFTIVYKTETHIVLVQDGDTVPRALSHATFLMKGPVFRPRATKQSVEE